MAALNRGVRNYNKEMKTSFLGYNECYRFTCPSDVRDGLKPVHRRILICDARSWEYRR